MNKQDIRRGLERYGDFLTISDVAGFLGVYRGTARGILSGLEYIPNGRSKLYHREDVAEAIYRRKER